jgi:hypothetical protein
MLTRGLRWPELQRKMPGSEILWQRWVGCSWAGGYRWALRSWMAQITSGDSYESGKRVKRDQETSAATNWRGGADHRRRLRGKIPAMQKRRAQLLGSGSFWMARGSGRGGCGGLGCGGAVQPRRGRGCSAAEEKRAAALRVSGGCCG